MQISSVKNEINIQKYSNKLYEPMYFSEQRPSEISLQGKRQNRME
jgi:hypothetical protein